MEKCHFLVSNLAFLRDLVHIKQGRHAVFQCTSNTKMSLDWKSSVEKYCYIWQTAYISQKKQEIDLQGPLFKLLLLLLLYLRP